MPSEAVIDKAAKLLKGNLVVLAGTARRYDVGIDGKYSVYIGTAIKDHTEAGDFYHCTCKHGQEHGPRTRDDLDNVCHHIVAVIDMDTRIMRNVTRRISNG